MACQRPADVSSLHRLIGITPNSLPRHQLVQACRAAEAGGVTAIQVRLKDVRADELLRVTCEIVDRVGVPVLVNDRADVAARAGAAGVHFGWDDFPSGFARTVVPRPMKLGVSVGNETEARDAVGADADYWSVGPFFATDTKPDAGEALSDIGFRRVSALAPSGVSVIAIGGITAANVDQVLQAGAAGVAVVGAIFHAHDIERAARELRERLDAWGD